MGFPNNDQQQAVPAAPDKKAAKTGEGGGGLRQWLIDSYNGLYKIVLEPSMPRRYQVYLILLGAILGLLWAWAIYPAVFTGANPERLNQGAQDQWVKMIAVAASSEAEYNETTAADLLNRIPNPNETLQRLIDSSEGTDRAALENLQAMVAVVAPQGLAGTPAPGQNGILTSIFQILLIMILITIITPIWTLLWRILIYPNVVSGIIDQFRKMTDKEYAADQQKAAEARAVARLNLAARKDMVIEADVDLGDPVMKTLSIFNAGRSYDDSFEIELPLDKGGDFLGQCGAVLAEAVDPDPVAIELWLFDMFSQQNIKKVLITEAGNNDPSIRGRLAGDVDNPATDIVVAANGAKLIINSDKLKLQGEVTDLVVDERGRFKEFKIRVAAWQKTGAKVAAPMGASMGGMNVPPPIPAAKPLPDYGNMQFDAPPAIPPAKPLPTYDDIQFDPPPPMPTGFSNPPMTPPSQAPMTPPSQGFMPQPITPLSGGMRPLTPPPLFPNADNDDDDPFGGTGDFTPLGN